MELLKTNHDPDDNIVARDYQVELFKKTLTGNRIIFLPTGSGKTYIAVMLIKSLSDKVRIPFDKGGKRTFFIVNTVALVTQQCAYVARNTDLKCGGYSGDMDVDSWEDDRWCEEFRNNQVLVMTAQICLNLLDHGMIKLSQINLLIFDECHHATKSHPMHEIMKKFEGFKEHEQPRVLGMTATLLNSNIKPESIDKVIHELEITMHATIDTVSSIESVEKYGKPEEIFLKYSEAPRCDITKDLLSILTYAKQILTQTQFQKNLETVNKSSKVFLPKSKDERLKNLLEDIQIHFQIQGLYFGNFSILYYLKKIEEIKRITNDPQSLVVLDFIKTQMVVMRCIINSTMEQPTELGNIRKHSSDKLLKLFDYLHQFSAKNGEKKFCAIIFVQRRFTAKVMYKVLQKLHEHDPRFKFLVPDYILGNSADSFKTPIEGICSNEWNRKALKRFRDGEVNCLVATDVLDEGVDIPLCNLIVCYDPPQNYRAYMQSKGRGRYKHSKFVVLVESHDSSYLARYNLFQQIEQTLRNSLVGKTAQRPQPTQDELESLYENEIEPYTVIDANGGVAMITASAAINLLEHYCGTLTRKTKFSHKSPIYKLITKKARCPLNFALEIEVFKVSVRMPINCPLREEIIGRTMDNISSAKQAAALEVCKRLHQMEELTDRLLPRDTKEIVGDIIDLLPYWRHEDQENKKIVGTKNSKRFYSYADPVAFYKCFPVIDQENYLHLIKLQMLPLPNNQVFCKMINNPSNFALLTSRPIKQIPNFPIFMTYGPVNVSISANFKRFACSAAELELLRKFHWIVFKDILELLRNFMVLQNTNSDPINPADNYLIVPLNADNKIDWNVAQNYDTVELKPIEIDANNCPDVQELDLVIPKYRTTEKAYIVLQVRDDMSPKSFFANNKFESYIDFYLEKYNVQIENVNQRLLEVRTISKDIHFIKPRMYSMSAEPSTKKYQRIIHLIPELCAKVNFSSIYWLKARCLPSILHRVRYLSLAEDFRAQVAREAKVGTEEIVLSAGDKQFFELLESSPQVDEEEEIANKMDELIPVESYDDLEPVTHKREPGDLERQIENISVMDIMDFQDYTCEILAKANFIRKLVHVAEFSKRANVKAPLLRVLQTSSLNTPPNASEILCALTPKFANDAFNFERLETLGDSFLKFLSSIFLFEKFPNKTEGYLTTYKGSMVSNRHLFYCGENKKLPSFINAIDFVPTINFAIPACAPPTEVLDFIRDNGRTPDVLYEVNIPLQEQFYGAISEASRLEIFRKITSYEPGERDDLAYLFHGQTVPDKSVADCVEALTGIYLLKSGLAAAARLLQWFGVVPPKVSIDQVLFGAPLSAKVGDGEVDYHMPWRRSIEERIGYTFRDRSFLLQAFTQASYTVNTATASYDRLEFLGDAIIDTLITSYIYENCGDLSPGDLTDLRSALVNNITFACLTVKYGLHTAMLAYAPSLAESIERFLKYQQERDYQVDDELLWVLMQEDECYMAEYVDVPKALGDLFESVIGAVFLDSGKDYQRTWQVLYSLMNAEIDKFSKKVPKQSVRKIYETSGIKPHFLQSTVVEQGRCVMVPLEIERNGKKKVFSGFGATKKQAKAAAAKLALKHIFKKNVNF
ncbi:endoribonuclease Dcr-2 [Cotesia typhae]|uniref:endoribonuclease Dcr-2 n=1 Tax=Cotesia typhae TaxID=2053667 RepID=UPI003D69A1D5